MEASTEDYFSQLRKLAVTVDKGVKEVQSRMDCCEFGIDQHSNETQALLFLRHSSKDLKSMKSSARDIRKDFDLRSSSVNSVSELFSQTLQSFQQRLETVESFIENYGYQRPSGPSLEGEEIKSKESASDESSHGNDNENESANDEPQGSSSNETESSDSGKVKSPPNPQTPRLEDIGLSEHTLFDLKMGNYRNDDHHTPTREDKARSAGIVKCQADEISTPKLESYGMSEHTLMFLHKVTRKDDKENICNPPNHAGTISATENTLSHLSHTPARFVDAQFQTKSVEYQYQRNGQVSGMETPIALSSKPSSFYSPPSFTDSQNNNKYKLFSNGLDSPKTPLLPELTTHFFIDPPKMEIPITESRKFDSPRTPPLPELQTCVLSEIELPKVPNISERGHSGCGLFDKTPPFPKLSSTK